RVVLLNQGVKLGEGGPKEMIDRYKQVLVGQYPMEESGTESLLEDEQLRRAAAKGSGTADMALNVNPEVLEYGSKKAVITEYYIADDEERKTAAIIKGDRFHIHMKVNIIEDIEAPVFAFTIKNVKGTEITGTNTMFEKAFLESVKAGETKEIIFTQDMNLQGGEYLLSLGVTGYEGDEFTVYHRLYDIMNITVISDKDTVGFYDMNSKIQVI
ncbi:MAG: ABC transporter ATP-binding protein, partial [Lachnospiraceae bacterium]|nr:ABC transporter ATP-binding protein [Lachnospiraceae bacterium]